MAYAGQAASYNRAMSSGLVLFAHGARDPRWREPFDRLATQLRAARPNLPLRLAFLELMAPTLEVAAGELVAEGCSAIAVVPIFLGQGGHVRQDLPAAVDRVRARHPSLQVELRAAIGEDETVLAAIAQAVLAGLASTSDAVSQAGSTAGEGAASRT